MLELKTPWRDGTTHLVMSPLDFMQRLAALVPRPKLYLIRLHGVLEPNAKLRAMVVPQGPEPAARAAQPTECEANCVNAAVMADPRIAGMGPHSMPFDGKRMFWGGFESVVDCG